MAVAYDATAIVTISGYSPHDNIEVLAERLRGVRPIDNLGVENGGNLAEEGHSCSLGEMRRQTVDERLVACGLRWK